MLTLEHDNLVFRFPQVHEQAQASIELQITLRIPDDTKDYPLPPGLGRFPLRHSEDFRARVPQTWAERGGVMLPMFRTEALWLNFRRQQNAYPCAVKVAAGKINAVSGKPWKPELDAAENDYVVIPHQPWLDGFAVGTGQIRQFVAMPLGGGYTAEEQITGKAEWGGLQLIVYPMKRERWEAMERARIERECQEMARRAALLEHQRKAREQQAPRPAPPPAAPPPAAASAARPANPAFFSQKFSHGRTKTVQCERKGAPAARSASPGNIMFAAEAAMDEPSHSMRRAARAEPSRREAPLQEAPTAMGLGAGGLMRQDIYKDPYGIDAWDRSTSSRCFLTLVEAGDWVRITGEEMRREPPTAQIYAEHGLPWFDYGAEGLEALAGATELSMLSTVGEVAAGKGLDPLSGNETVEASPLVKLGPDTGAPLLAPVKETGS